MNEIISNVICLVITLTLSVGFCLLFRKTVKNNCSLKTTAISLGISFFGALGLFSVFEWVSIAAFHEYSRYPNLYPASIAIGNVSLVMFALLIVLYLVQRRKKPSFKGFCIDVLTSIVYLPFFGVVISFACMIIKSL